MYNIKDALKSGTSKEQLLKDYEAALAEAQAELEAEALAKEQAELAMTDLDEARLEAVYAVLDYAVALDVCKETDITDELINRIVDTVKKEEVDLVKKIKLMNMITSMSKAAMAKPVAGTTIKDMDALEAFLKGL